MAKYNYYSTLDDKQKREYNKRSVLYNKENVKKVTVGLSHELDAAMMVYIRENGYKSKNNFILELIKREIGWKPEE